MCFNCQYSLLTKVQRYAIMRNNGKKNLRQTFLMLQGSLIWHERSGIKVQVMELNFFFCKLFSLLLSDTMKQNLLPNQSIIPLCHWIYAPLSSRYCWNYERSHSHFVGHNFIHILKNATKVESFKSNFTFFFQFTKNASLNSVGYFLKHLQVTVIFHILIESSGLGGKNAILPSGKTDKTAFAVFLWGKN